MSITGTNTLSIRKKDLASQKSVATGFKKTIFAHKAAAGETGINIGSLNTPIELSSAGFTNPGLDEIISAKMKVFRSNVRITSSARGVLMDYLSYSIVSSTQINWVGFTSLLNEIFTIEIDNNVRTGVNYVDAAPLVSTGALAAGVQDFSVGMPFQVNKYSNAQVGAITVYVDGLQQYRNVGNVTASPSADGNYQEIDAGGGSGTIIRFNTSEAYIRNITVISTGLLVEKPNDSQLAEIENVQGQVNKLVDTVAVIAGVPTSDFQAAPSNVQLKQFGDRVIDLEGWEIIAGAVTLSQKRVRKVLVDTSGIGFTITLPASPNTGDSIMFMDRAGTFASNNLTVNRNGNNILGIADNFVFDAIDAWGEFVFSGASRGWIMRT